MRRVLASFLLVVIYCAPEAHTATVWAPDSLEFGTSGVAKVAVGTSAAARDMFLQPDGKIVVVGTGSALIRVARFNTDGTPDGTFGMGGVAEGPSGVAIAGGLLSDGRIVVAVGDAVVCFLSDGGIDSTFGTNGTAPYPSVSFLKQIVVQSDDKIVAGGSCCGGAWTNPTGYLARYDPDGSIDSTFSEDGQISGIGDIDGNLVLQPDGKILGSGINRALVSSKAFGARWNSNGSIDCSFNCAPPCTTCNGGAISIVWGGTYDRAWSTGLQPDGKILIGGNAQNLGSSALSRLNPSGSLDTAFGTGGTVLANHTTSISGIAIQSNGDIVCSGTSNLGVVRYLSSGVVDSSFGANGMLVSPNSGTSVKVAIQADGKIITAGTSGGEFAVARFAELSLVGIPDDTFSSMVGFAAKPNPFSRSTQITFNMQQELKVELTVYDLNGRLVGRVFEGLIPSGPQEVSWNGSREDGSRVPGGIYFLRLALGDRSVVRKVVFLK